MTIHKDQHPLAGMLVKIHCAGMDPDHLDGQDFLLEDWWDRIGAQSWMYSKGNPACLKYAMRGGFSGLPVDDEVVYGKVGPFGHLLHVSELGEIVQ